MPIDDGVADIVARLNHPKHGDEPVTEAACDGHGLTWPSIHMVDGNVLLMLPHDEATRLLDAERSQRCLVRIAKTLEIDIESADGVCDCSAMQHTHKEPVVLRTPSGQPFRGDRVQGAHWGKGNELRIVLDGGEVLSDTWSTRGAAQNFLDQVDYAMRGMATDCVKDEPQ